MMIIGTGVILLVLTLALVGYRNEAVAFRDWEYVLNAEGLKVYSETANQVLFERRMSEISLDDAALLNKQGDIGGAIRHLRIGAEVVGDCSDSLVQLLHNTGLLSRHAAAIAPSSPLLPPQFNTRTLATLAGLHQLGHHLLITTRDRLMFRLTILRCGVRQASKLMLRATWRLSGDLTNPKRWRRMDDLRGDLGTLTDESLQTLRVVLASLAAVPRAEVRSAPRTAG
jgi:hypothetical protein